MSEGMALPKKYLFVLVQTLFFGLKTHSVSALHQPFSFKHTPGHYVEFLHLFSLLQPPPTTKLRECFGKTHLVSGLGWGGVFWRLLWFSLQQAGAEGGLAA